MKLLAMLTKCQDHSPGKRKRGSKLGGVEPRKTARHEILMEESNADDESKTYFLGRYRGGM